MNSLNEREALDERGQFEKIGFLIAILIAGVIISIIFQKWGDPYNLSPIIWAVVILLLIYIGIKN